MNIKIKFILVSFTAAICLFLYFIWPTPYIYRTDRGIPIMINRFTYKWSVMPNKNILSFSKQNGPISQGPKLTIDSLSNTKYRIDLDVPVTEKDYKKCSVNYLSQLSKYNEFIQDAKRNHYNDQQIFDFLSVRDKSLILSIDLFLRCYYKRVPIIQVKDGDWTWYGEDREQTIDMVEVVKDKIGFGYFDHNDLEDAVVLLEETTSSKGSNDLSSYYIAAVKNNNGIPVNIATLRLGDADRVSKITVQPGEIIVDEFSSKIGKTETIGYFIRGNTLIENRIYNSF